VKVPALLAGSLEPVGDDGCFVGGEVGEHDVDLQIAPRRLVDLLEEARFGSRCRPVALVDESAELVAALDLAGWLADCRVGRFERQELVATNEPRPHVGRCSCHLGSSWLLWRVWTR